MAGIVDFQTASVALGAVCAPFSWEGEGVQAVLSVITLEHIDDATHPKADEMAFFLRVSGDVPAEALFRWASAQGLHPFPGEAWATVSADIRLVFEIFTAVCKAVRPIFDPPAPKERSIPFGPAAPVRAEDTIFEREPEFGARENYGKPAPFTVVSLAEAQAAAKQRAVEIDPPPPPGPVYLNIPAAVAQPVGNDGSVRVDMGLIERTVQAARTPPVPVQPGATLVTGAERADPAPEAEAEQTRTIEATVDGEKIAGEVKVGKTKSAGAKK